MARLTKNSERLVYVGRCPKVAIIKDIAPDREERERSRVEISAPRTDVGPGSSPEEGGKRRDENGAHAIACAAMKPIDCTFRFAKGRSRGSIHI